MPMCFTIKTSKHFTRGSKFIYQGIQSTRYLSKSLPDAVDPVIEQNDFFAHPEHLLLAINQDEEKIIRVWTSKNSEGKADRCKMENSKNIHGIKN